MNKTTNDGERKEKKAVFLMGIELFVVWGRETRVELRAFHGVLAAKG